MYLHDNRNYTHTHTYKTPYIPQETHNLRDGQIKTFCAFV